MQCKWCKREIESDDTPCPYCGHQFKRGFMTWWPVIIIISFIHPPLTLLIGIWLIWCRQSIIKELEERKKESIQKRQQKNKDINRE